MTLSFLTDGMSGLIAPALAAGLLVAATHVPLGREVLRRGIVFLDLAVAQIAALGVVIASLWLGWNGLAGQATAFICALVAALIFSRLEGKGQATQEAVIGCSFVLAASAAMLVFAGDPHGGEEISNLMAGQILWVNWQQIGVMAAVYVPVLSIILYRPDWAGRWFYILFALCITLSVQMVGVYLVFASLILPALAVGQGGSLIKAYIVAGVAVSGGLIVSVLSDLPSGPVMVCAYGLAALCPNFLVFLKK